MSRVACAGWRNDHCFLYFTVLNDQGFHGDIESELYSIFPSNSLWPYWFFCCCCCWQVGSSRCSGGWSCASSTTPEQQNHFYSQDNRTTFFLYEMYFVRERYVGHSLLFLSQDDTFADGSSFCTFGVAEVRMKCRQTSQVLMEMEKQLDLENFFSSGSEYVVILDAEVCLHQDSCWEQPCSGISSEAHTEVCLSFRMSFMS